MNNLSSDDTTKPPSKEKLGYVSAFDEITRMQAQVLEKRKMALTHKMTCNFQRMLHERKLLMKKFSRGLSDNRSRKKGARHS